MEIVQARIKPSQKTEPLPISYDITYSGLTRGARANVQIKIRTERPRSGASLYALTLQALRANEFQERPNSMTALEEKTRRRQSRRQVEWKQCTLDQCRRLVDCDCLGLYDTNDKGS